MKSIIYRCNCRKTWSIQNRKTKKIASTVLLNGNWFTELKPDRRRNPRGFVTTKKCEDIILNPATELLDQFEKTAKLTYDKININFNMKHGRYLYFAEDGTCYILIKRSETFAPM